MLKPLFLFVQACVHTAGATDIADLIQTHCALKVLTLEANNLGDDGINVISGPLGKSNIDRLEIGECGITVMGAKVLAETFLINKSITLLRLSKNPITLEGARMILESAVGNGVCLKVIIDDHLYEDDDETQLMMETLQARERRKLLKVCI